ncbi:copper-binding protein [Sphingomonas sp.]|uniref:copper-binding protein n=1 Tax=Sphingomonas sp. TaxID=28214 RepID=UPI0025D9B2D1|nr:copper-binding protein [Sphingomonas sp.]
MNVVRSAGALALALLLVACGEKYSPVPESGHAAASPTPNTEAKNFSGTGTVQSITGDKVTIAHGPIEGLGWPAMTMTFAAKPTQLAGFDLGDRVAFAFRQEGGRFVISSIARQQP